MRVRPCCFAGPRAGWGGGLPRESAQRGAVLVEAAGSDPARPLPPSRLPLTQHPLAPPLRSVLFTNWPFPTLCALRLPSHLILATPLLRYDRTGQDVGQRIKRAVREANEDLELVWDGPPPWEKCCSVRYTAFGTAISRPFSSDERRAGATCACARRCFGTVAALTTAPVLRSARCAAGPALLLCPPLQNDKVRIEAKQVEACPPLKPNPWPLDWPPTKERQG